MIKPGQKVKVIVNKSKAHKLDGINYLEPGDVVTVHSVREKTITYLIKDYHNTIPIEDVEAYCNCNYVTLWNKGCQCGAIN